jgi:hypothetical protein
MKNHSPYQGDIKVSGYIPVAKAVRFYGERDAPEQIDRAENDLIEQTFYCGHKASSASKVVCRFLAIGVIPTIHATLKEDER